MWSSWWASTIRRLLFSPIHESAKNHIRTLEHLMSLIDIANRNPEITRLCGCTLVFGQRHQTTVIQRRRLTNFVRVMNKTNYADTNTKDLNECGTSATHDSSESDIVQRPNVLKFAFCLVTHSLTLCLFTFPFQKCFHPKVRRQRMHTWLSFTEILIAFASRFRRCFEFRPPNRNTNGKTQVCTQTRYTPNNDRHNDNQSRTKQELIYMGVTGAARHLSLWMWNIRFEFYRILHPNFTRNAQNTFLTILRNENVTHHTHLAKQQ